MQYNHYPSSPQGHVPHPSQSPDEYAASPYSDLSHHHPTLAYAAVNSASHMPGSIGAAHQSQYSYSAYSPDDHRSYYTASSQGHAVEHYSTPSSPPDSYTTSNSSGNLTQQPRHHPHLSQSPQQQPQFIPTPSQAYQVYSSSGSTSSPRSRSSVEPYYHMSPNPQHVVHPSASSTHATSAGGRGNTAAHGSSSSHSSHHAANTHTGMIVVAPGERYPCNLCDRSFTRLHDRRRHYETVHATSPVLHKCRFCRKDFSRADSLKRHIDNGCDECRDRV